ncbi:uncharacterized protein PRCAT00002511001 [Priceomyces carsonii]|uniref:uncharacterized protein n=1 Tax=Priceomyces carsonii TaxID=28549 RepID=UPI002ED90171|nr:unnamed protein product [Priceomyces carsonii]
MAKTEPRSVQKRIAPHVLIDDDNRIQILSSIEPIAEEIISFDNIVNLTAKLMDISDFELRLVRFFDAYCIDLFSFRKDMYVENIWRRCVPYYFCKSPLLRQAVYLFSCLNLWPLFDYEKYGQGSHITNLDLASQGKVYLRKGCEVRKPNDDEIYLKTTYYFLNTIREKNSAINKLVGFENGASSHETGDLAVELFFTCTLIFSFLGIHSHRLVPLVSFNHGIKNDFLGVCRGLLITRDVCEKSCGENLQRFFWTTRRVAVNGTKDISITSSLDKQLLEYFSRETINSASTLKRECFTGAINVLNRVMSTASTLNNPIPVFSWVLLVNHDLLNYIWSQDFFALRILYVYACLCQISRFLLNISQNMWVDYILWFKNYNQSNFGGWKYDFDKGFYNLIKSEYLIEHGNFAVYTSLDPTDLR